MNQGVWIEGKSEKLSVLRRDWLAANNWTNTINFENLSKDISNSVLYVDGRVQDPGITVAVDTPSSKSLCKLGVVHTAGSSPFRGTMDDVRIYNRALSAYEAMQLYNQGKK